MAVFAVNEKRRYPLLLSWSLVRLSVVGTLSWWWRFLPSSFPSVRPSVRLSLLMCQGGFRWTDILEILYFVLLSKPGAKIQIWLLSDKNIGRFT
jgi:hypothetical protein